MAEYIAKGDNHFRSLITSTKPKGKNAWEMPSLKTYLTSIMIRKKKTLVFIYGYIVTKYGCNCLKYIFPKEVCIILHSTYVFMSNFGCEVKYNQILGDNHFDDLNRWCISVYIYVSIDKKGYSPKLCTLE
jgi:hypothetical protein